MINDFNEYQIRAGETDIIPEENKLAYYPLGLNGEAGEVCEKVEQYVKRGYRFNAPEEKDDLVKELGDVCWYIARMTAWMGLGMNVIAADRTPAGITYELGRSCLIAPEFRMIRHQQQLNTATGKVADAIKKVIRDGGGYIDNEKTTTILKGLTDALCAVALMAEFIGYPMQQVLQMNIDKLMSRKKRGVIGGSGDNR